MTPCKTAIHAAVWGPRWCGADLDRTLESAARIGYDHVAVPLRRFEDVDPPALDRAFRAQGLTPLNTCGLSPDTDVGSADADARGRGVARLRTAVAMARDMGSPQINGVLYGPLGKAGGPPQPDAVARAAECMAEVADYAAAAGVRLALEMVNRYETNLLNTVDQALAFLDMAGHSNLWLHLDTYHMSIEEADPIGAIRRALPRLSYFELDQGNRGNLNDGSLDLRAWTAQLFAAGYTGIVGVEAFSRSRLSPDHADALAVWRDTYTDPDQLAATGLRLINEAAAAA
ncbi:sugar phosphate isomerase/epimerase [Azospirillum sp. RWY-5-1]|uniref:Sugar phosphate isomerase/epimerase n=1 Tax=Azospirillum oleiclasticum TaxID=2735135 RepID=A0ABX2T757_9PROT|nr:sugar phosphate isomerase/epimerase [Azospirillum oleiclasticum]NYZ19630.1 sugar phosphate isomerase/epimerase [Azospirillum oleiclasticum]